VRLQTNTIIERRGDHQNHAAYSDRVIAREEVQSRVKRKAEDEPHTKPVKLIRQAIRNTEGATTTLEHSDMSLIRKSAYDHRRKQFPTLPKTTEEALQQLRDMQDTILHKNAKFCHFFEDIPIFTCAENLELLRTAEHVFADGTFSHSPKHFTQLYSIHVYIQDFYVPIMFCFLQNKTAETYSRMWRGILKLCSEFFNEWPVIKALHVDFEKAAHKAAVQQFPGCRLICCTFHLAQAWFREIQRNKTLLREYNSQSSEIGYWLKSFFGLSYLPPAEVWDGFMTLNAEPPTSITTFTDYVLDNYVFDISQFPPTLWASEPSDDPRTTNAVESFHKHFNSLFYSQPHIHQVVDVLLDIQLDTDLKLNSINRLKRHPIRPAQAKRDFLQDIYSEYRRGAINTKQYLRSVGYRYQPSKLK